MTAVLLLKIANENGKKSWSRIFDIVKIHFTLGITATVND